MTKSLTDPFHDGLQTALYGMLFWAIIAVLGFSLLALWQVCSSRPAKPSAVIVAAVTLVAAIPLLLIAMLAAFTDDPPQEKFRREIDTAIF